MAVLEGTVPNREADGADKRRWMSIDEVWFRSQCESLEMEDTGRCVMTSQDFCSVQYALLLSDEDDECV